MSAVVEEPAGVKNVPLLIWMVTEISEAWAEVVGMAAFVA